MSYGVVVLEWFGYLLRVASFDSEGHIWSAGHMVSRKEQTLYLGKAQESCCWGEGGVTAMGLIMNSTKCSNLH